MTADLDWSPGPWTGLSNALALDGPSPRLWRDMYYSTGAHILSQAEVHAVLMALNSF